MEKLKLCSRCNTTKPVTEYHIRRKSPDGLAVYCKACEKKLQHEWYMRKKCVTDMTPGCQATSSNVNDA